MADYNSAYTGAQIDTAIGLAGAHAQRHAAGGADALSLTSLAGTLSVAKGGTGAASASAARAALGVTLGNLGAEAKRLQFTDTQVAVSAFAASTAYPAFPYQASVALSGVTAAMTPEVVFSPTDALSGNFAPVAAAFAGGVLLYAAAVPAAAVTIPTIICWKAV